MDLHIMDPYEVYVHPIASRLFLSPSEADQVEMYHVNFSEHDRPVTMRIESAAHLLAILAEDSHGLFLVTEEIFSIFYEKIGLSPAFLKMLDSFGFRTRDDNEECGRYHTTRNLRGQSQISELCFSIRYPARHGRSHPKDPWSGMRHMALYQRFCSATQSYCGILLHPSQHVRSSLPTVFCSTDTLLELKSLYAPYTIITIAGRDWPAYLNYLEDCIYKIETKALLASPVKRHDRDWEVSFQDIQTLQKLRRRLLKADGALKASRRIALQIESLIRDLDIVQNPLSPSLLANISMYHANVETDLEAVTRLLSTCEGISNMASNLLFYANEQSMKAIASAQQSQQFQAQKDSRNMKILTLVGIIYLPASLVATVFSSNLVQSVSEGRSGHFALSRQFWLFPLITSILMLVTITPIMMYIRLRIGVSKPAHDV